MKLLPLLDSVKSGGKNTHFLSERSAEKQLSLPNIAENIDIFDFALTDQEMADIAALNRDEKHDWY